MFDSASPAGGRFPRPLHSFRCSECGYGARARSEPDRCPMCGARSWETEPWRPFSALHRDLASLRRRALSGDARTATERRPVVEPKAGEGRRELNDRIALLTRSLSQPRDMLVEFVCECGESDCDAVLQLTLEEYAAVRSAEGYVAVVPGHQPLDAELVAYTDRYVFATSPD